MGRRSAYASALREVTSKSERQIEQETAGKWAARAAACYQRYAETGLEKWLIRAEDYRHEAIEHAACAEDGGKTLARIERELKAHGNRRRRS